MVRKTQAYTSQDDGETMTETPPEPKKLTPPELPTVGMIVHYYTRETGKQYHGSEGPYAAMVTNVQELPAHVKDEVEITAQVSLMVFPAGDMYVRPYTVLDVFGVTAGDEHELKSWWQWPEKA